MTIDLIHFTPWDALFGGVLVGSGAALLFLGTGRIAGVSGIFGKLVCDQAPDSGWRFAFLLGLVGSGILWAALGDPQGAFQVSLETPGAWAAFCVAGILAGFGARMANGCTSGHGVCGLARLSGRSLVAVPCFMAAGAATVYATRHVFGS
ncbi:MAG: YeeE/YedE family protein [Dechloromonas sp.]|nr:YeeE/YedE family protein [Dechloromonas sp.]